MMNYDEEDDISSDSRCITIGGLRSSKDIGGIKMNTELSKKCLDRITVVTEASGMAKQELVDLARTSELVEMYLKSADVTELRCDGMKIKGQLLKE
jgi:hypothetical protein